MDPFEFKQCIGLLKATGRKAKNLHELRAGIEGASKESVYYHTSQYLLKARKLEYTNEFAQWAGESLGERVLAEHLSIVDPYEFKDFVDLKDKLLTVIDDYLETFPEPREVIPGNEFYFNETITLVMSSGMEVDNLAEFLVAARHLDDSSIYYHFYESRTRLGGEDDFTNWLEDSLGETELAEKMRAIDPFMYGIEGTRNLIVKMVEERVKTTMESLEI